MSSNLSLTASVRTCQVNTGEVNRIQSDRFLNPNSMVCVAWDGVDLVGRSVCPDSWFTKTAGCDSAEDRVLVENELRPDYFSFIGYDASGLQGHIYGNVDARNESTQRDKWIQGRNNITGHFNSSFSKNLTDTGRCTINSYERAMAQMSQAQRTQNAVQNGYIANANRRASGN